MVKKVVLSSDIKLVVEFMLSYGLKLKRRAFFFSGLYGISYCSVKPFFISSEDRILIITSM